MASVEAEAGAATETKRNKRIEASVEEDAVDAMVEAEEEAVEATTTTTMVQEVVATTTEAEVAEATTMDTRTTSIRVINNTHSHIFSSKCLQQFCYLIQHPVQHLTFKATAW